MTISSLADRPDSVDADPVNILIVDDEPKNLLVLETVLDDPGYRLIRANSGDQALLALMAHEFAVLVLDVRMPGMTGVQVVPLAHKKDRDLAIIMLTAVNDAATATEVLASGATT